MNCVLICVGKWQHYDAKYGKRKELGIEGIEGIEK